MLWVLEAGIWHHGSAGSCAAPRDWRREVLFWFLFVPFAPGPPPSHCRSGRSFDEEAGLLVHALRE
jgi:hypothetical protein